MQLDDCDIDEFNKLLEAKEKHDEAVATTIDGCEAVQAREGDNAHSDDVIFIGSQSKLPLQTTSITTGIASIEIDGDFSLEYTYTTDVSSFVY